MSDTLMPTFRSEDLSLMQSALAEVLARQGEAERSRGRRRGFGEEAGAEAAPAPTTPEEVADDPRMLTFAGVAARWADEEDLPAETRELRELTGGEPSEEAGGRGVPELAEADRALREGVEAAVSRKLEVAAARGVTDCVELFMRVAKAEESGDPEQIDHWRNVVRFSNCDANFIDECVEAYLGFKLSARRVPYRRHQSLDDFVIDVPDRVRIGVIGDWGTGMEPARVVLQALADQRPDIVLHVGDIYYSGTRNEVNKRFLPIVEDVFPDALSARKPRLFTLSGNHDMYSGGRGYYALLDQIGQPASYFCLRNRGWQVLGMDTGLHDRNPIPPHKLTKLDDGEAEWHRDKVRRAGGRRTVLMSHHQLFTFEKALSQDAQGRPSGLNVHLYGQLRDVLAQVSLWLWGHEHNFVVHDPWPTGQQRVALKRGRCLGASAVPVLKDADVYKVDGKLKDAPTFRADLKLGRGDDCWHHCFAVLELDGGRGEIGYFQVPHAGGPAEEIFRERIDD